METKADEMLREAEENVEASIRCLSKIVIDRCQGCDEYENFFKEGLRKALFDLIEIRNTIEL